MKTRAQAESASFSDLCKNALESSLALWPLYIIRALFMIGNLVFFGLALMLCCFPLVQFLLQHADAIGTSNFKNLFLQSDFTSYLTSGYTWLAFIALGALYVAVTWLFFAFYDSSVYSQLFWNQKKSRLFSWGQFLEDGIRFTLPMMGLELVIVTSFILYLVVGCILGVLGAVIFHFVAWWIGAFLAFPFALLFGAGFLVLLTAGGIGGVYLVEGKGPLEAFQNGLSLALKDKGRITALFFVVIAIYLVFYCAFNVVFSIFGLMPVIGLLFKLFVMVVNTALMIGLNIFLDSLSVAARLDARDSD